ncbi:MAG: MFS transporter, partial [Dehalococcoidia bacterium]
LGAPGRSPASEEGVEHVAIPDAAPGAPPTRPRFFYGWVIVGVCFLAQFGGTIVSAYGLTVMLVPMSEDMGWSRTAIVGANIPASISAAVASPFLGRLVNRIGARVPMTVAAVLGGVSIMSIAFVHDLWMYYLLFGVVNGLSRPIVQVIGISVGVAEWFVRRRALAASIVSVSVPISGLVGIPLAQALVTELGWRSTWVALGAVLILVVALPTAIFWRPRPEAMGLLPDGDTEAGAAEAEEHDRTQTRSRWGPYRSPVDWTARDAIGTRAFWVVAIVPTIIALTGPAFATHVVAFFISKGLESQAAAVAATSFVIGTFISRFLWGILGARLHIQYCYVLLGLIAMVGTVLILVSPTVEAAYASVLFFGLAAGGILQLRLQIWPDYFGRRDIATMRGYTAPFELLGFATGPLLAAWVYDQTGSYHDALLIFAVLSGIGMVIMLTLGAPPKPRPGQVEAVAAAG